MSRTVADELLEVLVQAGVRRVYGLVGDGLNAFSDAVRRDGRVEGARPSRGGSGVRRLGRGPADRSPHGLRRQLRTRQHPPDPGGDGRASFRRAGTGSGLPHSQSSDRHRLLPGDQTRGAVRARRWAVLGEIGPHSQGGTVVVEKCGNVGKRAGSESFRGPGHGGQHGAQLAGVVESGVPAGHVIETGDEPPADGPAVAEARRPSGLDPTLKTGTRANLLANSWQHNRFGNR